MSDYVEIIWEKVKTARHQNRPTSLQVIEALFPDFIELHGDRSFGDDQSIIGGLATIDNQPITIIAEEKGHDTQDKIKRNFGMPHPEGYRKALRLMQQAQKFKRPILCIIDTPGAYPGLGAEQRGQAGAIAMNLREMMGLETPIIVVVLGEGGSGGALAIGVGDYIGMFSQAIYSILSPEGFASILFKDSTRAKEAAVHMKITADDLKTLGVIDEIIDEKKGLHLSPDVGFKNLSKFIIKAVKKLNKVSIDQLLEQRYKKFRAMGQFGYEKEG